MKAILLSNLFFSEGESNKYKNLERTEFLYSTLLFLWNYLNIELDDYENSPYDKDKWYKPNCEYERLDYNLLTTKVYPLLLKMIYKTNNIVNLSEYNYIEFDDTTSVFETNEVVLKYLDYIKSNNLKGIAFSFPPNNYNLIDAKERNPSLIFKDYFCVPIVFCVWLDDTNVFDSLIKVLDEKGKFPNQILCSDFEENIRKYEKENSLSSEDKVGLYKKYYRVIAIRNGYTYDETLSRKYGRKYYINKNRTIAISCDTLHGGIEVFSGVHFKTHDGQFTFSCKESKIETKKNKGTHKL